MVNLAVIDENGICVGVKSVKSFIDDGFHVEIPSMSFDYLWRRYDGSEWSDEKYYPKKEEEPTMEDKINFLFYKEIGVIA